MLNMNNRPNIMARIPIITLNAENPASIDAIPRNSKLTPIRIDTNPELKIGKIIKINPKIIDNIPDILLGSIFFPPNFFYVKILKFKKHNAFYILNYLIYDI